MYEQARLLDHSLLQFDHLFSEVAMSVVFNRCILDEFSARIIGTDYDTVIQNAWYGMKVVFLLLLADEKRGRYRQGIGKCFGVFRRGVVVTALLSVRNSL